MNPLMTVIQQSDPNELSRIIRAVVSRYEELYPDWEFCFLSLPKNDMEERSQILQSAFEKMGKS